MKTKESIYIYGWPLLQVFIPSINYWPKTRRNTDQSDYDLCIRNTGFFRCKSHRNKVAEKKFRLYLKVMSKFVKANPYGHWTMLAAKEEK